MHFTLIRHIIISFLIVSVGFVLACLVALSSLEQVATELQVADVAALLDQIRTSQFLVLVLGLGGFLCGLVGMAFAAHQAALIIERLRQATRLLGDVVLDEMSTSEFLSASDGLDREIQEMMLKIKDSQLRYLDASPLTRLPGNLAIRAPAFSADERGDDSAIETFCAAFRDDDPINRFPLIVMVDDSALTARDESNFHWVTFTRSNPAVAGRIEPRPWAPSTRRAAWSGSGPPTMWVTAPERRCRGRFGSTTWRPR